MTIRTFHIETLGCRVNQYEGELLREQLERAGLTAGEGASDLVVVNTCTVTASADRKSRYSARRLKREHPGAFVVVTGCYAERNAREIEALGADLIVGQRAKDALVDRLRSLGILEAQPQEACAAGGPQGIGRFENRVRAFVKVQDGCNHACSFCKVVLVRGRSRSRPLEEIVAEVRRLAENGVREVVLAGIQLGAYGDDLGGTRLTRLAELARDVLRVEGVSRVRLSSIEPCDVTDELLDLMAGEPRFAPHLHIPLQSGSDRVLARMNRRYDAGFFRDLVARAVARVPRFRWTSDVMVAFPGETEEDFRATVDLVEDLRPLRLHVFSFSPREGTRAARFEGELPVHEAARRLSELTDLSAVLLSRHLGAAVGSRVKGLAESWDPAAGMAEGYTEHFMPVRWKALRSPAGDTVELGVEDFDAQGLIGFAGRDVDGAGD